MRTNQHSLSASEAWDMLKAPAKTEKWGEVAEDALAEDAFEEDPGNNNSAKVSRQRAASALSMLSLSESASRQAVSHL